jgi:predicted dehydrogenase
MPDRTLEAADEARQRGRIDVSQLEDRESPGRGRGAVPEDRIYTDWRAMAGTEPKRPDGIEVVAIITPNHTHHRSPARSSMPAST